MITCTCCGYKSIITEHDICDICGWQHDLAQETDPDDATGANRVSLREAQKNFLKFGAKDEKHMKRARPVNRKDIKDPDWSPISDSHDNSGLRNL